MSAQADQPAQRIFELLKRKGRLSASQIIVELVLLPEELIREPIQRLYDAGLIARRPDKKRPVDDDDPVWGINISLPRDRTRSR